VFGCELGLCVYGRVDVEVEVSTCSLLDEEKEVRGDERAYYVCPGRHYECKSSSLNTGVERSRMV
jgi:hypothetical protein